MARERVTNEDLANRLVVVNRLLPGPEHVAVQSRYGYCGLDLHGERGAVRTLRNGTKREVFDYLGAMIDTLHLVGGRG